MTSAHKILLICVAVQWLQANGNPFFQGLSFQRGFEINFKPWLKSPIMFIKEKWSPFGVFGKKIAIQKRSLDEIIPPVPRPAAPVFEYIEEQPIGTAPLNIVPKAPVYTSIPKVPPPPIVLPKPMPIIVNDYPPPPPIVPPIATNMVVIEPNKAANNDMSSVKGNTLYTDISRVESIEKYIHSYEISPSVPPKPVVVPPAPLPPTLIKPEPLPPPPLPSTLLPPATPVVVTPIPPPPVIENPSTVIVPPAPIANALPAPVAPPPSPPIPPPPPPSPPPSSPPLSLPPPLSPLPPPPLPPPSKPPPVLQLSPAPIAPEIPAPIAPEAATPVLPKEPIPIKEEHKEKPPAPPPVHHEVPKTDIVLKDSSLVKGSKMALQFGSVFLTLMAQFFDRARATIDLMTNPPPKFIE